MTGALQRAVSRSREAGTPDAAEARAVLRAELEALGYEVTEQRFRCSPVALRAFPLLGAGLVWLALLELPLLASGTVPSWTALAVWLVGGLAAAVLAAGTGLGWMPAAEEREDANLIATRPGGEVRRWIVAHVDTKAQGHSMAGRLVAVWCVLGAALLLTGLALARLGGPLALPWAAAGAAAALAAGALAGRGRLRGGSPGARDNGSGLVAALAAAGASSDPRLGVLLTGAEEFGLVGARILARHRPELLRGREVVNLDTLDDRGPLHLVSHDRPGHTLAGRLAGPLGELGLPVRRRRLPLGIFVDSHPLARGGAAAVTVARLDWGTLRRIHTAWDRADDLDLTTAERVGRTVARLD